MAAKCDLCGHLFESVEARDRHIDRDHATGLDRFTE